MRQTQQFHESDRRRVAVIRALALASLLAAAAFRLSAPTSAAPYNDPVEDLRQALKLDASPGVPLDEQRKFREKNLEERAKRLTSLGDLVRALLLPDWRNLNIKVRPEETSVDGYVRDKLAARLEDEFHKALAADNDRAWAAANLIGKTASEARKKSGKLGEPGPGLLVRERLQNLAPDLAKLTDRQNAQTPRPPEVRAAAAAALGQIEGKEEKTADGKETTSSAETVIVPALEKMLATDTPPCRRAAADALANLMRVQAQPERKNELLLATEVRRQGLARAGRNVVRVASNYMDDKDAGVSTTCADAIRQTAAALANEVLPPEKEPRDMERYAREVREEREALMPLMKALRQSVPLLIKAAQDPSRGDDVRITVFNTLEQMGDARERLRQRAESVPGSPLKGPAGEKGAGASEAPVKPARFAQGQPNATKKQEDPLLDGLRQAIHLLQGGLEADVPVPVRLAALDAVEMLGPEAEEAAPALNRNLTHPNPFVRRASARVLGKIGPVKDSNPVPRLAWLLEFDPDFDVRVTAATALDRYGSAALPAAPAAANVVASPRNDAEIRMVAARSLANMGSDAAKTAVPALAAALSDPDVRVRREAVQALYHFRQAAAGAREQLRQAVGDSDPEVSRIASEALLQITK